MDGSEFVAKSPDMDETDQQENNSDDAIPTESQEELDRGIESLRCPDCDGPMHQIRIIEYIVCPSSRVHRLTTNSFHTISGISVLTTAPRPELLLKVGTHKV